MTPRSNYYDMDGNPITIDRWVELINQSPKLNQIALDTVNNHAISTVWLGLDHNFFPGNPILIFETMVFSYNPETREIGNFESYLERYSTNEQALEGHNFVVSKLKLGLSPEEIRDITHNGEEKDE